VTSCLTRGDLEQTTVTAFVAELDHGAVTYGVTAIDVVRVELRSTEHPWRTAQLRELPTVSPNVRVFILVSGHHIERGALVGLGAAGTTIGEPTWVLWGAATVPGDGIECLCSEIA
jgi:hypothetical protein